MLIWEHCDSTGWRKGEDCSRELCYRADLGCPALALDMVLLGFRIMNKSSETAAVHPRREMLSWLQPKACDFVTPETSTPSFNRLEKSFQL